MVLKKHSVSFEEQSRQADSYRRNIRAAVRALWLGAMDIDQFFSAMDSIIRIGIPQAWYEGAAECGVKPNELRPEERIEIERAIASELNYVIGFGDAIEAGNKASGGKLTPLMMRADLWVNRFNQVKERGKGMACADQKAKWVYGDTIDHCDDCSRAVGRVYRLSTWEKYGWVPGSKELACGGWRCKCQRVPTDEPCTPGRPPILSSRKQ
jgi:hypothetical protein